jgi:hypothetical protein
MPRRKPIKLAAGRSVTEQPEPKKRVRIAIKKDWEIPAALPLQETRDPILLAPAGEIDLDPSSITPENMEALRQTNLALWCLTSKFKVDHSPFNFNMHRYLLPLYLSQSPTIVFQKAAQMGATIFSLLKILHILLYGARGVLPDEEGNHHVYPAKVGFFFPTQDGVAKLSKDRLSPLIQSNKELLSAAGEGPAKDFKESIMLKQFGPASLYLAHLGGSVSKDSTPMDFLAFDELRLVSPSDVSQAEERVSHSRLKGRMFVSTAGHPGLDINARFVRGKQYHWHSKCLCGKEPQDWVELSSVFPDCVVDTGKEVYYRCPKCGARIRDPQNGCYVPHNPDGAYDSFHIHQMASKYQTPEMIWDAWNTTDNLKEFFNAKLGRPYVDTESIPVTDEVVASCTNNEIRWDQPADHINCGMGVDQRSGELHVVIARKNARGKKQLVAVKVIQANNPRYMVKGKVVSPFYHLPYLMEKYDVDHCLIDAMPSVNEAMEFAREWPKRVWLAYYSHGHNMITWSDRPMGSKDPMTVRRATDLTKFKWNVALNRYSSIDFALKQWVDRRVEVPPLKGLQQVYKQASGRYEPGFLGEVFVDHLKRVCRTKVVTNEETNTFRMEWINLGLDPHFLHAWNYCCFALERTASQFMLTFV